MEEGNVQARKNAKYRYTIITLDTVNALVPYFNKMGDMGWNLVSVDSGKAFFKRIRSTSLNEDISDHVSHLKKELMKYESVPDKVDDIDEEFL